MMTASPSWTCCQLGAREHYAVPRALQAVGALDYLATDAWVPPGNLFGLASHSLRERFHPDLAAARIQAWNTGLIGFELAARLKGLSGWPLILSRNRWFQHKVVSFLTTDFRPLTSGSPALFSYSYSALEPLRFAKSHGWKTVLGQIDPGPAEERLVMRLHVQHPEYAREWRPAPSEYWRDWREECDLADCIVVNSTWSRKALEKEGVSNSKIRVIPLAYETPIEARNFQREYPNQFDEHRPMRVLFLGQVNLRKGVAGLLGAVGLLEDEAIEFQFVGPVQVSIPSDLANNARVHWVGSVSRGAVDSFYQDADVLILPTLSDGFGLTQLEAQAWSLPVIASQFCGHVVCDGKNGLVLQDLSGNAIAAALRSCLRDPSRLRAFAGNAATSEQFGLNTVGKQLLSLFGSTA
jgi:glycosyltransferase involved in cell wall biosynthesis